MGLSFSKRSNRSSNQEVGFEQSIEDRAEPLDTQMSERSNTGDFRTFTNHLANEKQIVKQWFDKVNALSTENHDLKNQTEELRKQNQNLQQSIDKINLSSKEVNKLSGVVEQFKKLDCAERRQAIEAFEKSVERDDHWYREDVACRIFVVAHDVAKSTKSAFIESVLPNFFQCAPSLVVNHQTKGSNSQEASELSVRSMQQSISREMESLFKGESFQIACSSVLMEMAVSCDLTALEEKTISELRKRRESWRNENPLLPNLDDNVLFKMKNFITECVKVSWKMVNQLPAMKIALPNKEDGDRLEEFFEKEEEELTEGVPTVTICVWPALTDFKGDEVLAKGKAAIIPRPQTQTSV